MAQRYHVAQGQDLRKLENDKGTSTFGPSFTKDFFGSLNLMKGFSSEDFPRDMDFSWKTTKSCKYFDKTIICKLK